MLITYCSHIAFLFQFTSLIIPLVNQFIFSVALDFLSFSRGSEVGGREWILQYWSDLRMLLIRPGPSFSSLWNSSVGSILLQATFAPIYQPVKRLYMSACWQQLSSKLTLLTEVFSLQYVEHPLDCVFWCAHLLVRIFTIAKRLFHGLMHKSTLLTQSFIIRISSTARIIGHEGSICSEFKSEYVTSPPPPPPPPGLFLPGDLAYTYVCDQHYVKRYAQIGMISNGGVQSGKRNK